MSVLHKTSKKLFVQKEGMWYETNLNKTYYFY
jgi:hypothetical protein